MQFKDKQEQNRNLSEKATWQWCLEGHFGKYEGTVEAVDPRDAVSRALTSKMEDGRLYGEVCGVPLSFIDAATGNFDPSFAYAENGIKLSVQRLDKARKVTWSYAVDDWNAAILVTRNDGATLLLQGNDAAEVRVEIERTRETDPDCSILFQKYSDGGAFQPAEDHMDAGKITQNGISDPLNVELEAMLEKLVLHVFHYASMPHANSAAHKDAADARALIAKFKSRKESQNAR